MGLSKAKKDLTPEERVEKVNRICKQVLKLEPEDFAAVEEMAERQCAFMHPLKYATAARMHKLGDHNKEVVRLLRMLRDQIESLKKPD
jgi:hypothetical protein